MHCIYYYSTKLDAPMWKQLAHAAELLDLAGQPQIGRPSLSFASISAPWSSSCRTTISKNYGATRSPVTIGEDKKDAARIIKEWQNILPGTHLVVFSAR